MVDFVRLNAKVFQLTRKASIWLAACLQIACNSSMPSTQGSVPQPVKTPEAAFEIVDAYYHSWTTGIQGKRGKNYYLKCVFGQQGVTVPFLGFQGERREFEWLNGAATTFNVGDTATLFFRIVERREEAVDALPLPESLPESVYTEEGEGELTKKPPVSDGLRYCVKGNCTFVKMPVFREQEVQSNR